MYGSAGAAIPLPKGVDRAGPAGDGNGIQAANCCEMNEQASTPKGRACAQGLKRIDDALNSTMGAMLSLDQFDEVTRLRRTVRECCEAGREQEARAALTQALKILRRQAPR